MRRPAESAADALSDFARSAAMLRLGRHPHRRDRPPPRPAILTRNARHFASMDLAVVDPFEKLLGGK